MAAEQPPLAAETLAGLLQSSYAAGTLESSEGGVLECKSQKNACLFSCKRPAP